MPGPFDPADAARLPVVIGCDEVGRGALCGPVVVAAAWFRPADLAPALLAALDDSKRVPAARRAALAVAIRSAAPVALAAASAAEIDRAGIGAATLAAMRRAVLRLGIATETLVDGRDAPEGLGLPCRAVVRGDATVPQIAAASIVAKVCRDRLMRRLARRHAGYGWETNVGYGAAAHLAALARLGPTPHHRMTFAPVAQLLGRG